MLLLFRYTFTYFEYSITQNKQIMDFLDNDYQAPQGSANYAKLQDGENRFRILAKPIIGWVGWSAGTPSRFTMKNRPDKNFDDNKPAKHFWDMLVWNYQTKSVQILEITQTLIQQALQTLARSEDWGNPYEYDIIITKSGKDKNTKYNVQPAKPKPLTDEIKKAALDKPVYLEALYTGADPFVVNGQQTELAFTNLPF